MISTAEEIVTKLLSNNEFIHNNVSATMNMSSFQTLGEFLEEVKNEPNPYGEKYRFIR